MTQITYSQTHTRRLAYRWFIVCAIGAALLFVLYDHRAHAIGILPYLILLACPLMHLFHHRAGKHPRS